MQIYFASLLAIQQRTLSLDHERCNYCHQFHQLVSHGFVYKKQSGGQPQQAVGKRVLCSNRRGRTGCGRTMQLYLNTTIRYLHYLGCCVVAFVLTLVAGATVQQAYEAATDTAEPRNAYRWLNKLMAQLSAHRSVAHQPPAPAVEADGPASGHLRRSLLAATFTGLLQQFEQPLCAHYQTRTQRSFV